MSFIGDATPEHRDSPEWSVMIPVCNRLKYLRETLDSVLAQAPDPGKMQICIVDNSTEDIDWVNILSESDRNRIEIFKQKTHLPLMANWNTCIELARGNLVHILHDDDWVLSGFYSRVSLEASRHPECGGFFVRCFVVAEDGSIERLANRYRELEVASRSPGELRYYNDVLCPGVVIRRSAYEKVGNFNLKLTFCHDWEMWIRVIRNCWGVSINEPLAAYRYYAGNETSRQAASGENFEDCLRFADLQEASDPLFDRKRFETFIVNWMKKQEDEFRRIGNKNAVAANAAIRKRLERKLPLRQRARLGLVEIKRALFG
jgi:glycosyltransferase involved in cell wall biosynthesis